MQYLSIFELHDASIQDNSVRVYTLAGDSLSEKKTFKSSGEISDMAYSPDGANLAVAEARSIVLYDAASYEVREGLGQGV